MALMYREILKVIISARVRCGDTGRIIPSMSPEQMRKLETMFQQNNLIDISTSEAKAVQGAFTDLCEEVRQESAWPSKLEGITIVLASANQNQIGELIHLNAELNKLLQNFYFKSTNVRTSVVNKEDVARFLEMYDLAADDETRRALITIPRKNSDGVAIDKFQNWKTKILSERGIPLPSGVTFQKGESEAAINGNLMDFHVLAAYLQTKYNGDDIKLLQTLFFLECTSAREKKAFTNKIEELAWLCSGQTNAMLVPGFRLTKSKLLSALYLLKPKSAACLPALTFPSFSQGNKVIGLLSEIFRVQSRYPISDETAGIKTLICNTIRKFFQPRSYFLSKSQLDLTLYTINENISDWYYYLNFDILMSRKGSFAFHHSITAKDLFNTHYLNVSRSLASGYSVKPGNGNAFSISTFDATAESIDAEDDDFINENA